MPSAHGEGAAAGSGQAWPAGQDVQFAAPVRGPVYVPAGHAPQGPAEAPAAEVPAAHAAGTADADEHAWPGGHGLHVAAPAVAAKWPAGQARHADAAVALADAPADPAGHATGLEQPPAHHVPAGHAAHAAPPALDEQATA